jgi:Nucleotidyl transferase AbiEii toxin, Type IV TA system
VLLPETERVWSFLKQQPSLAGFVLIDGTALALRIHHRRSDDLDLAYPRVRLPHARLEELRRAANQSGFNFQWEDNEAAVEEFANAGMDLHDYQQNFVVNGAVRVAFFVPDCTLARVLAAPPESTVRLATIQEMFQAKCLVSAARSKTRDWLDLYLLLRDHGFSMRDFQKAFEKAGAQSQCGAALSRLCSGVPQAGDEGYAHLLTSPPSLTEIRDYFIRQRDLLEIESAADALRRRAGGSPPSGPESK